MTDLVAADSVWHVFSNFGAFLAGGLICWALASRFGISAKLAITLYIWHTLFCVGYFYYSLSNVADSTNYFRFSLLPLHDFSLGNQSVHYLTAIFSVGLGFSYFGCFLVFNLFGAIGNLAVASSLIEATQGKVRWVRRTALLIPFLPGLNFWSAAVGKDSLSYLSAGLACWAIMNFKKRYMVAVIAVLCMLSVRPHIAAIMLVALVVPIVFALKANAMLKISLIAVIAIAAPFAVFFGMDYAGVGSSANLGDINSYIEKRQGYNLEGGGSVDISTMILPAKLFTYAFRPLLLDANSVMSLIASGENLVLLVLFAAGLFGVILRRSCISAFGILFLAIYISVSWLLLAETTANLGIAVRQKLMFLPMLLLLAISLQKSVRTRVHSGYAGPSPHVSGFHRAKLLR